MKELFIEKDDYLRFLLVENKEIKLLRYFDYDNKVSQKDIFIGIIKNVVPSLNSVFIDIGSKKNAYIYVKEKEKLRDYKVGTRIAVEVLREEIKDKGAKVTDNISISDGNFVITKGEKYSFSKNANKAAIKNKFKEKISESYNNINILYRSNVLTLDEKEFILKRKKLIEEFYNILRKCDNSLTIGKITNRFGILDEILSENADIIIIHTNDDKVTSYITENYSFNVEYNDEIDLFYKFGLEKQVEKLKVNKVSLKNGGNIIIEETEAMTVIDVNSKKGSKEDKDSFSYEVNIEAINEIHRQINLRNISGIIVVDLIDINKENYKVDLYKEAVSLFSKDKTFTKVYPLTELSLLQIARRREGKSIYHYLLNSNSRAEKLNINYLIKLIKIELKKLQKVNDINDYKITIDPYYKKEIEANKEALIKLLNESLEESFKKNNKEDIYFKNYTFEFKYDYIDDGFKVETKIFG